MTKEEKEKALRALLDDLASAETRVEREGWIDANDMEKSMMSEREGGDVE